MVDDRTLPETPTPKKPAARRRPTTPSKTGASKAQPAKPQPDVPAETKAPKAKAPPKPRSSNRATLPVATAHKAPTKVGAAAETATKKVGGNWGAAALVGGLVMAGTATAALLSLRSSSAKSTDPAKPAGPGVKADEPDGSAPSRSLEARIAEENAVPEAAKPA